MNATAKISSRKSRSSAPRQPVVVPRVRQPDFPLPEDLPRYWWKGDPAHTLLLVALSSGFPPGERFFIDSVRRFQEQIQDPALQQAVRGFIGQEAHHSKEHKQLNDFLQQRGFPMARLEQEIQRFMDWMRRNLSAERQLAHTVAVEHFTALMAEEFLLKYPALEDMDPRIAPIWAWHAIEESEHKSVAIDVYRAVGGREWVRCSEMLFVSVMFPLFSTMHLVQLMQQEGQLGNLRSWAGLANYLWGRPGVFRRLLPSYLRYYRPGFHPRDHDAESLVARARRRWLSEG